MSKEMGCKKEKIRDFINENQLIGHIAFVLEKISINMTNQKTPENIEMIQNGGDGKYQNLKPKNELDFEIFNNLKQSIPNFINFDGRQDMIYY